MSRSVGMSRNINLDYLNKIVELMNSNQEGKIIKSELQEYISFYIQDKTNLSKTVNILMNIWISEDESSRVIKNYATRVVNKNYATSKLVAHWCMILVSYSVFKDIASTIGKLENMQLELSSKLIREKMLDAWGERTTLIHAIPKNIKTMKDIGVLEQLKVGRYKANKVEIIDEESHVLIIATLISLKDKLYMSVDELMADDVMFPFKYEVDLEALQESNLFSFDRFGGETVISLKE